MSKIIRLEEMTYEEIETALKNGTDTVVFAIGSNEQHGPCLPVCTDTSVGEHMAYLVAEKLGNALKGPTINIGFSEHHMKFKGTISLRKETLQDLVMDYCSSLARHGFRRIVIILSHGGNYEPLAEIVGKLQDAHPRVRIIVYLDFKGYVDTFYATSARLGISKQECGGHAGEFEVSMMMYARPDLVRKNKIAESNGFMGELTDQNTAKIYKEGIGALSPNGVLGSPRRASPENGMAYIQDLVASIVEYISEAEKNAVNTKQLVEYITKYASR